MNLMNCCCQCVARIVKSITTIAPGGSHTTQTSIQSIRMGWLVAFPVATLDGDSTKLVLDEHMMDLAQRLVLANLTALGI